MPHPLLSIRGCSQIYTKDSSAELAVLDDVSFSIEPGEIVGLVGRAGSGKSTLLRIASGLLKPTGGEVIWQGRPLHAPTPEIGLVFQSFALFPWLTVEQNISLGLEAQRLPRGVRQERTDWIVDLIGLSGYENAYPKELSGAMQQRTGLARALALKPNLLLMDEPFAELDHLTAENLRTDLIELWSEHKLPIQSMMLVTHNIEEAVLMCDRILLFSSNPGRISYELRVPFDHPRNRDDAEFRAFVDQIYTLMTRRAPLVSEADEEAGLSAPAPNPLAIVLPPLQINVMVGLMETLAAAPLDGRADLPMLAERLQMALDDLFPIGESLQLLGFAELEDGDILLTEDGGHFVEAEHEQRRESMRTALLHAIPLIRMIRTVLDERPTHAVSTDRFRKELEACMSPAYAQQTLQTAVNWARYAELFDFDEEADQFLLDEDEIG
ncbi:ABC transporter ATP-binding protein [Acidomonas methanolica]|uniref:ABC transporter nitrate/sulfonate/bicarbonate permease n=1 Tax=Acidomonas methanolica NBRC 104435 TaxID=1231351 RepID=A0A023D6N8_ACIMT|nr:nitrate/sulfonate/bicarbonate ABC transporter ATP-binding protein [Acidomonas methanolica]MBU2653168.1 nitrate/sulfonate/bicarbonate ABC transporter ATP-binding protein [Acidomonas methanolica]TCS32117.1 NitT/TauT family transport system ATP-binding protein [Acidomonas methanolica]GAJ29405.1 ABC transporter nitrate/sulfonate/bicarbonate permease [Acidomonas methanolica NBRC 104435]GBQ55982.1 nitrate/sulfonate/bicarbonate transporter ATP-binding protein [Acidomonas methanolica]GEK97550.1 ABC